MKKIFLAMFFMASVYPQIWTSQIGNMLKSIYDTNNDGIVDQAEYVSGAMAFALIAELASNAYYSVWSGSNSNAIWADGAGNTVMFDGEYSSYYTNLSNTIGFLPTNRIADLSSFVKSIEDANRTITFSWDFAVDGYFDNTWTNVYSNDFNFVGANTIDGTTTPYWYGFNWEVPYDTNGDPHGPYIFVRQQETNYMLIEWQFDTGGLGMRKGLQMPYPQVSKFTPGIIELMFSNYSGADFPPTNGKITFFISVLKVD